MLPSDEILDLTETNPAASPVDDEPKKRNCGRTGPTSSAGRTISSRNAVSHGMCAKTLILKNESEQDWIDLLAVWNKTYGDPEADSLLAHFILKTTQAEWYRLRAQREYDLFLSSMEEQPLFRWTAEQHKTHELALRYKTGAERAFQREYRLLEQHFKTHHAPLKPEKAVKAGPNPPEFNPKPQKRVVLIDRGTGLPIDYQEKDKTATPVTDSPLLPLPAAS